MAHRRSGKPASTPGAAPSSREALHTPGVFSLKRKLVLAGILLAAYVFLGTWGQFDFSDLMGYNNLLADGLLQGHLYIAPTPAQGPLQDMIPFQGHYYLQWGPFPGALHLIFRLFDSTLTDRVACLVAGWLSALVFLEIILTLRRLYFRAASPWLCTWFFFAFALATPTCLVAFQGTIYHESIAIAALLLLAAFWASLHYLESFQSPWLLVAGSGLAAAVLTRTSYVLQAAAVIAAVGLFLWLRRPPVRTLAAHLALLLLPLAFAGLLTAAYNYARFGSPFEFGLQYLPAAGHEALQHAHSGVFDLRRAPENFCHYVLAPLRFGADFPWITHEGWKPRRTTGRAEDMSSLFLASPFLLLGALAWTVLRRPGPAAPALRIFLLAAIAAASLTFFSLLCFDGASRRYMQDFVPLLMIVAFAGAATRSWDRWRPAAALLLLGSALLHVHLSFCQFATSAAVDTNAMTTFVAISPLLRRIAPGRKLDDYEAITHNDLGVICLQAGQAYEALGHFERAAQLLPHSDRVRKNLELARTLSVQHSVPERSNR
jgi:hypothetical protein